MFDIISMGDVKCREKCVTHAIMYVMLVVCFFWVVCAFVSHLLHLEAEKLYF